MLWSNSQSVRDLSGIEINQDQVPATESSFIDSSVTPATQTFSLPSDFTRGAITPDITGFQVCLKVTDIDTSVNYTFEYLDGTTWTEIISGTEVGSHAVGNRVWFDIYLPNALIVTKDLLSKQFRLSVQSDSGWWYSSPSPLPEETFTQANATGMFRLLSTSADNGTDFLGNKYRSVVYKNAAESIATSSTANSSWISKPNPSKFAVESLYFDLSDDDGNPTVIDRILVDPITPGVAFHVYYSNQGLAGTDNDSWEDRLWTPIQQTYKAERRQEHALPDPVVTKYAKVEFSSLQAKPYQAGTFQTPIRYKKYPKWVLDYFLTVAGVNTNSEDQFIPRQVNVTFDALRLAYDYYLDDLRQEPLPANVSSQDVQTFLATRDDLSDKISVETMQAINLNLSIYRTRITDIARREDSILQLGVSDGGNYSNELVYPDVADTTQVSTLDRDAVAQELQLPKMFFYLTARHQYREVEATFQEDRAYFVGVRELSFNRDHYAIAADTPLYIENTGDMTNTWRSDFVHTDGQWRVYDG